MASQSLWKESIRQPRQVSGTTQSQHKNMIKTPFGRRAKIHLKRQDLSELSTKRSKALKPGYGNNNNNNQQQQIGNGGGDSNASESRNQNNKRPIQVDEHSSGNAPKRSRQN